MGMNELNPPADDNQAAFERRELSRMGPDDPYDFEVPEMSPVGRLAFEVGALAAQAYMANAIELERRRKAAAQAQFEVWTHGRSCSLAIAR